MKDKLTNSLPQIRCSEETRKIWDEISDKNRRTLSNTLQIVTEDIAKHYLTTGKILTFETEL